MKKEKIYVVLTGGTICSVPDSTGKNHSDATATNTRLTNYYLEHSDSPFKEDVEFAIETLSPDGVSIVRLYKSILTFAAAFRLNVSALL